MNLDLDTLIDLLADEVAERVAAKLADQAGPRDPDPPDRLMTVEEAATYLRAKPRRVYELVRTGAIDVERDGRRVLIRKLTLDQHLHQPTNETKGNTQ